MRERFTVVRLDDQEYFKALEVSSALGIAGGAIYHTVLAHCALKAKAQAIYTWNTKDFTQLGSIIANRVKTPSE